MQRLSLINLKSLALSIATIALLVAGQTIARADELRLFGTTTGLFGTEPPSSTLGELTYEPALVNGTTNGGVLVLNAAPGEPNVNNLGSFTLVGDPKSFTGAFTLTVQFASPRGIGEGNPRRFNASAFVQDGFLIIAFSNPTQLFTFSDPSFGVGAFVLSLEDVFFCLTCPNSLALNVNAPRVRTLPLTGTIRLVSAPTAVPEPATMLLLATGLAGVAARVRRRRQ